MSKLKFPSFIPSTFLDVKQLEKKDGLIKEILNQLSYLNKCQNNVQKMWSNIDRFKTHLQNAILALENLMIFIDRSKEVSCTDRNSILIFVANTMRSIVENPYFSKFVE